MGLLSLLSFHIHAQYETCGTVIPDYLLDSLLRDINNQNSRNIVMERNINNEDTLFFPIQFHIIRTSSHIGGLDVSNIPIIINNLNEYYINAKILFYTCGEVDYIDDDSYYYTAYNYHTQRTELENNYNYPNVINMYFFPSMTSGSYGLAGVSVFPGDTNNSISIANSYALDTTIPHEMGHYFNLFHTHETAIGVEFVTRGQYANCLNAGDLCCDTPADPNLFDYSIVNSFCQYIGNLRDPRGELYEPDPTNIMSYNPYESCLTHFTDEQYSRIRAAAYHPSRYSMAHIQNIRDLTISGNYTISEGSINLKNIQLQNAHLVLEYCDEIVIESDFNMDKNSILQTQEE